MPAIRTNPYNDPNYLGGGYYFGTGNDQLPGGGGLNTIGNGGNLFDPGGVDLFGNVQGMSDDDLLSMFGFDQGADVPENPDSCGMRACGGALILVRGVEETMVLILVAVMVVAMVPVLVLDLLVLVLVALVVVLGGVEHSISTPAILHNGHPPLTGV